MKKLGLVKLTISQKSTRGKMQISITLTKGSVQVLRHNTRDGGVQS